MTADLFAYADALFGGPAPRLRAAPASVAFLDLLAEKLIEALASPSNPFALSDALILLPNRRATRGLIDAFAQRLGGAAMLPTIRPIGDPQLDDDPDVWREALSFDVAPAIEAPRQRMELAALIRARDAAAGGVEDPSRAIALADELGKLLESAAAAEHVHWDKLPRLAGDIALAKHWEASAAFLDIIATYWPQRLKLDGLTDPGARRAQVLLALAEEWKRNPPDRPIVIAGSTGSLAPTRALMRVVASLPRGVVVFPGLDVDLDDEAWDAVRDQHPQFALKETLAAFGIQRHDVRVLGEETPRGRARRVLMREALAPAEKTADWLARVQAAGGKPFVEQGAHGLTLLEAATEDEEAAAIALILRKALDENRSAALATPDVGLARRVEAKLLRWGVEPVVTHGRPLMETPAGVLIALLCELALDPGDPVTLAALLKHPRVRLGMAPEKLASARTALEHEGLRGARRYETLAELEALAEAPHARHLVRRLAEALASLGPPANGADASKAMPAGTPAVQETTLASFADALVEAAERLAPPSTLWRDADGELAAKFLEETIAHGGELGAMAPHAAPRALMKLMEKRETSPASGGDPRVAIWGLLEARLQRCDLMILGGLNEGVWPAPAPEDPFLSRAMRRELGLPSLDARLGLAAHDFAQLANAPEIVLTRSLRREGAPTLASRWLWRLETLAKGAGAPLKRAEEPLAWARALDAPSIEDPARTQARAARVPRPKPPADARPKRISVTQVETLIRDPYAIYARHVLKLEVLKPIGMAASYAERGTAIHAGIEAFADGDDPQVLIALLLDALKHQGFPPTRCSSEQARLFASAQAYVAWLRETRSEGVAVHAEKLGELLLPSGVTLRAKADRIEIRNGAGHIIDFKSGSPPSSEQVNSGLAPQMTLQAAMLSRGAFKEIGKARAEALTYWKFGGRDPKPNPIKLENGAHEAGEQALAELERLLAQYADPAQPYLSKPRVQFLKPYDDYDHLARRKEWADAEGDE